MKVPATRAYLLNPESIALTDMVMNLFIFFFVSFSLLYTFSAERLARLDVTLPKAATADAASEGLVVVTITRDGVCYLDERVVSEGRLRGELRDLVKHRPGSSFLVRADEAAPCRALVAVFDAGRAVNVRRMSFAVRPKDVVK